MQHCPTKMDFFPPFSSLCAMAKKAAHIFSKINFLLPKSRNIRCVTTKNVSLVRSNWKIKFLILPYYYWKNNAPFCRYMFFKYYYYFFYIIIIDCNKFFNCCDNTWFLFEFLIWTIFFYWNWCWAITTNNLNQYNYLP